MHCHKQPLSPPSPKFLLIAGIAAACFAQVTLAACPPGYLSKAGHCIPGPAQPPHVVVAQPLVHAPLTVSPVPTGNAALNPQPIPPGHVLVKPSTPPAPSGPTPHWDVKANKKS
jgi:hypothetical protein